MKGSGLTWDEATFKEYIKNPKAKVPADVARYGHSGQTLLDGRSRAGVRRAGGGSTNAPTLSAARPADVAAAVSVF